MGHLCIFFKTVKAFRYLVNELCECALSGTDLYHRKTLGFLIILCDGLNNTIEDHCIDEKMLAKKTSHMIYSLCLIKEIFLSIEICQQIERSSDDYYVLLSFVFVVFFFCLLGFS